MPKSPNKRSERVIDALGSGKVAVVTPYHRESVDVLRRCVESVRSQTFPAWHYLVADGFPQTWIDDDIARGVPRLRHMKLEVAHADDGNTPRGLGALLAISEGATAVSFLDGDNYLTPTHVSHCLDCARSGPDYVVARRRFELPDGTPIPMPSETYRSNVDTNSFFLLPGAFHAVSQWILQPKPLTKHCDTLFFWRLRQDGLRFVAAPETTIVYVADYEWAWRKVGREPPANAKPRVRLADREQWWRDLDEKRRRLYRRHLGLPSFDAPSRPTGPTDDRR